MAGETCLNICHWYFRVKSDLHENAIGDWKLHGDILLWKTLPLLNNPHSTWAIREAVQKMNHVSHYLPLGRLASQNAESPGASEPELISKNQKTSQTPQCRRVQISADNSLPAISHTLRNKLFFRLRDLLFEGQAFVLCEVHLTSSFMEGEAIPWPPVNRQSWGKEYQACLLWRKLSVSPPGSIKGVAPAWSRLITSVPPSCFSRSCSDAQTHKFPGSSGWRVCPTLLPAEKRNLPQGRPHNRRADGTEGENSELFQPRKVFDDFI